MLRTLQDHFGFSEFRGGQEKVIRILLDGRPSLAVFPTGGGKSLCYQLPALLLDGTTLVVSPLIALMKDQVDRLKSRGIAAERLDSTLDAVEQAEILRRLSAGEVKLLYVSPERLANPKFRDVLKGMNIAMAAVDEAHCISEWGHNFRPDYLKLAKILRSLKISRTLALTATATPKVARDIRKHFRIAAEDHVQLSFHRPNLELKVTPMDAAERKPRLLEKLNASDGASVVYVTRQETAEEVATFLAKNEVSARAYHAGLPDDVRSDAQREFMAGEVRVIVATIAFGMGIDKSDIRNVIHYNLPKSIENYTQEIGRAGRDGADAVCEMLACAEDLTVLENFIHADTPSSRALENLLDRVLRQGERFDVSPYDLSVACDMRPAVVSTVMAYLETEGFVEVTGTFYSNYRIKLLSPVEKILSGRSAAERKFVQRLLGAGEEKRWWLHFQPTDLAAEFGVSRDKIVSALSDLERAGDAAVKVSGSRRAYRLKKDPGPVGEFSARLSKVFHDREQADLGRLEQVLGLASRRGCLTGYLTAHFGEKLAEPCGHCDRCRGVPAKTVKRKPARRIKDDELSAIRDIVDERHAALSGTRQLARFLCGMTSPATIRARLTKHNAFGMLGDVPFADVLAIAETMIY